MMLCDHAVVADGKLYINGGGWSVKGTAPSPSAIALKIDVPWDRTNKRIPLALRLVGADGEPVDQISPDGKQRVEIHAEFEVGRPPGMPEGTPLDVPLAINIPPLQLDAGKRYSWELEIDGKTQPDWHLSFFVRAAPSNRAP